MLWRPNTFIIFKTRLSHLHINARGGDREWSPEPDEASGHLVSTWALDIWLDSLKQIQDSHRISYFIEFLVILAHLQSLRPCRSAQGDSYIILTRQKCMHHQLASVYQIDEQIFSFINLIIVCTVATLGSNLLRLGYPFANSSVHREFSRLKLTVCQTWVI